MRVTLNKSSQDESDLSYGCIKLQNKLNLIQGKTKILNKKVKKHLILLILLPIIMLGIAIVMLIVSQILFNNTSLYDKFIDIFVGCTFAYIIYAIIAIIIILINIYKQLFTCDKQLINIKTQLEQLKIENPKLIIQVNSLAELNNFNIDAIKEYLKSKTDIIRDAFWIITNNNKLVNDYKNTLEIYIDNLINTKKLIIKIKDKNLLTDCIRLISDIENSVAQEKLIIIIKYISPENQEHSKQFEIDYKYMSNIMQAIDNIVLNE